MAKIQGIDQLISNLEALATITDDDAIVQAGGQELLREQRRLVRVKLSKNSRGVLEGTLQVIPINNLKVEIGVPADTLPYALAHEYGVVIVPRNKQALAFVVDGEDVVVKSVTLPARPYVRPSVSKGKQAAKAMVNEINKKMREKIKL